MNNLVPTTDQFIAYQNLFSYFNKNLFGSELPDILLNLSRPGNVVAGFFSPIRWKYDSGQNTHEITINPISITKGKVYVCETLVHEMCHLWQYVYGKRSKNGYHNKEWANKMESIGLMPSSTGEPGGKKLGYSMSDYVIEGGVLDELIQKMPDNIWLPLTSLDLIDIDSIDINDEEMIALITERDKEKKKKTKTTYVCEGCGLKVWGRKNLNLNCNDCNLELEEIEQ